MESEVTQPDGNVDVNQLPQPTFTFGSLGESNFPKLAALDRGQALPCAQPRELTPSEKVELRYTTVHTTL